MMAPVSRSFRTVEVLSDMDPVFREVCGVLYGPAVDPQEIWEDIFKASPDSADVDGPTGGSSLKRRLAFASTAAGAVLGAKELGEQLPKLGGRVGASAERAMTRINSGTRKIVPTGVRQAVSTPRGRVAVAGTALGGDVVAGNELDPRKQSQQNVGKAVPSVGEMAEGIQSKLKRLMPGARAADPNPAASLGAARAGGDPSVASAYSSAQRPSAAGAAPGTDPSAVPGARPRPNPGANPTTPGTQAPLGGTTSAAAAPGTGSPAATPPGVATTPRMPDPAQVPGTSPAGGPAQAGPAPGSTPPPTPGAQAGPAPVGGSTPQAGSVGSESYQNGQAVGQLLSSATATPARKVVVGGAAAAAAARVHSNRQQNQDPYAAYYGKRDAGADFSAVVQIAKFDDEKHLVFGWASVTKLDGHDVFDRQGDYIDADDLEDAAVRFMQNSRKGGHMHRRTLDDTPVHVSDIVESVVFTDEKVEKLGLPETFPRGWWVGVKIHDDDVWDEVRKGRLPGFSIHGRGKRSPLDLRELAGAR